MTRRLSDVNFKEIVAGYKDAFETIQVLDPTGKVVDEETIASVSNEELVNLMEHIVWGRTFDDRSILLARQGAIGIYPPSGGQEASQFGPFLAISKEDFLVPTYREFGAIIKHGLPMYKIFLWSKGHAAGNTYSKDFPCYAPQVMVGGTPMPAAAIALGYKLRGERKLALAYCGDGATSQGDFYEGINFAGVYNVPMILIIQNNRYGISVPVSKQTAAETLAQKGVAAGVLSLQVDGLDPVAMYAATKKAREYVLEGNGPVIIEALTYRFGPHTMSDDPKRYRSDEEVEEMKKQDPLIRLRKYLTEKGLWTQEKEDTIIERCKEEVKEAMKQVAAEPPMKVSELLTNMYEVLPESIREQRDSYLEKENR